MCNNFTSDHTFWSIHMIERVAMINNHVLLYSLCTVDLVFKEAVCGFVSFSIYYTYRFAVSLCPDRDECGLRNHNCDTHSECINTIGSYVCQCKAGYIHPPGLQHTCIGIYCYIYVFIEDLLLLYTQFYVQYIV